MTSVTTSKIKANQTQTTPPQAPIDSNVAMPSASSAESRRSKQEYSSSDALMTPQPKEMTPIKNHPPSNSFKAASAASSSFINYIKFMRMTVLVMMIICLCRHL